LRKKDSRAVKNSPRLRCISRNIARIRVFACIWLIVVAVLFSVCLTARAQAIKPKIEQYAERCKVERQAALANLRKELIDLRKKRDVDRDERKVQVERLNAQISDLESPLKPYYGSGIQFFAAQVGDIGWFDKVANNMRSYRVISIKAFDIVDESNLLVEISSTSYTANTSNTHGSKLMWVSGIDTSKLENGGDVDLTGLIAVTGNKTYETSTGSNTVLVLELINPKPFDDLFTRRDEKRTWKSNSGHTTDAIYVRYESGRAILVGLDGKTMKVRLSDLSEDDRKFVSEQIKASAKSK
jgi:hypothetical protein